MMNRNILHPMMFETPTPPTPTIDRGIYRNESLGLISFTSDRYLERWTTIADKDLGAPQVGQVGLFYQWGNSHGFNPYLLQTSSEAVTAENYGPYYYSDIFITGFTWDGSNNLNLWGDITNTNEARRGPSLTGYHVPSKDENIELVSIMTALGIDTSNGNCMKIYLKMPFPGYRDDFGTSVMNLGTHGYYWSSSAYSTNRAYELTFDSNSLGNAGSFRTNGFSIRPFKNEFVIPDSSWIQLHSGIFWEPEQGIISVTQDGVTGITIADKNLGATAVYSDGDELTESNCGKYFQRGNNYGFPFSGAVTASSTQADATNYGPYYYGDKFILQSWDYDLDWNTVVNNNLWGGEVGTVEATRGPCSEGFHIPSSSEMSSLINEMVNLGMINDWGSQNIWTYMNEYLKMPQTGKISGDGYYSSSYFNYYLNDAVGGHQNGPYVLRRDSGYPLAIGTAQVRCNAYSIRPFKNEPVAPDSTRTKLL